METSTSVDRQRNSSKEKPKPVGYATPLVLGGFVVLAIALKLSRPSHAVCQYEHSIRKTTCRVKELQGIPSEVPDLVLVLQMGDPYDQEDNNFIVLRRGNLTRFKKLKELSLVRCGIEEIQEDTFSDLKELRSLDLRYNRIQSLSEAAFRGLTELSYLALSNNPIQFLGDHLFRGLTVNQLMFANNPVLSGISPRAFSESSVSNLVFNRCNFKSFSWSMLAPIKGSLTELEVSNNLQQLDIDEDTFKEFSLRKLTLVNDGMKDAMFLKYGDHEEIFLDGNSFENAQFPEMTEQDWDKKRTKHLSLTNSKLTKILKENLSFFLELETLNLSSNSIELLNATALEDLDNLTTLDLSDNDLIDFHGDFKNELMQLRVLKLQDNHIQTVPVALQPLLSHLTEFTIHRNPFHCNCQIRWLADWLIISATEPGVRSAANDMVCHSPEKMNFSQVSDYGFQCKSPTIMNATIDVEDGITLVCTAEGDPAPSITWRAPSGQECTEDPPQKTADHQVYQTRGRMTIAKDGNYTCTAKNVAGIDSIVVDTDNMPTAGLKFSMENTRVEILATPQGFIATALLLCILGYLFRHESE